MKTILLLFLSQVCFADCAIPAILMQLRPGAAWSINGETYAGITWLDATQTKPTAAEVTQAISDCRTAASSRAALKVQARAILKDTTTTQAQKIQSLILLLDFDQ